MRIILYTGKGGVGKTTVAAATAAGCAQRGYRTVVVSTDAAHSLGDSLDQKLQPGLNRITDRLHAEEVNVNDQIRDHWGAVHRFLTEFLSRQGFERLLAEELAILPGMEELFSLLKIQRYHDDDRFDVVIVDCAPTASTMRMLSFPDMIRWYMKKLFHIERRVTTLIKPVVEKMSDLILPDNEVFDTFEDLFTRAGAVKDVLADPDTSSCRLVANAERMVLAESQRAFTYLNLFGYRVDAVFVNRLLPESLTDPYWAQWKKLQRELVREATEKFQPLPVFRIEQLDREVVGLDLLLRMCEMMFGSSDPTDFFFRETVMEFASTDRGFRLTLSVPFADRRDLQLTAGPEELTIRIGSFRRNVLLPRPVAALKIARAKLEDHKLHVFFEEADSNGGN